ncbi:MAG TPA: TonB family protein [Candidatus Acidoferrales bacterium]|nr:TonB family protein [Candidatus Acidoferrales bacterium]
MDFQPYVIALLTTTRRKWMEKPQDEAMLGEKDLVVIHVTVRKDGTFEQPPTIETASKNGPFDDAALEAVRASAPFDPLPKSFSRPDLELRLVFSYKHSPSLRLLGVFPRPVVRSTPVRSNG